jgi:omega-6 fatty acid desaturase (delta-12 desaturase)
MNDETSIFPNKPINEFELFMKYKPSYTSAFIDFSVHTFLMCSSFYSLWYFRNSWLSVFTIPLLGLLHVKTFIIFHDCGHNSYTPSKKLNYIIGIITGVFAITPFSWNFNHNTHHLSIGNVENIYDYPYNETIYHSLRQYTSFSPIKRCLYKLVRQPYFFFSGVPMLNFLIKMRFNAFSFLNKKLSVEHKEAFIIAEQIINNLGIFVLFYSLFKRDIFFYFLIGVLICSSCGIMLFHTQHGFNPPYVVDNTTFNQRDSGLAGSSFIKIPYLLKYFTGGIEYHHIHHMNAKIPGYNLQKYHEEVVSKSNMFDNVVKLSMNDCYNNLWLVLYDEDKKRYITFAEADEEIRKNKDV